jgi:hypothetical protein
MGHRTTAGSESMVDSRAWGSTAVPRLGRSSGLLLMVLLEGGVAEMVTWWCSIEAPGGVSMGRWF